MIDQVKYRFEARATDWWTIVERIHLGNNVYDELDYECDYRSYDEAWCALHYIKWLEQVYSPPRT